MATITFSKRFENIMQIAKVLAEKGQDPAGAKVEAQAVEEQFLAAAGTDSSQYQELIDDYIEVQAALSVPTDVDSSDSDKVPGEVFNTDGPTFGEYEWATYHADGVTSTIYKARATTGSREVVALKVMQPDHLQLPHNAHRELSVLRSARSDAIVPLLDSFQQPGGRLILVFPFLRQDLENLLRTDTLTLPQSKMVFHCLFSALSYIHSLGMIHRDIKPSNMLLKSPAGPAYLIDFGIVWTPASVYASEDENAKITDVGTTVYRPPELLFGRRNYDTSLDMWAAGCVVAEMVRKGHWPLFEAPEGNELGLIKSIFETLGTPNEEIWPGARHCPDWGKVKFKDFPGKRWQDVVEGANDEVVDFVRRTVCYESTRRLTAEEALQHPIVETFR